MSDRLVDGDFLRRLDRLSLRFDSAVNGSMSGGRRSKKTGSTVEFSGFREYAQGDDFRRIDWNAYGRFEKLFIRLFLDERQLGVTIFVDASASMSFGEPDKLTAALRFAAASAYVCASAADCVSVALMRDGKAEERVSRITGRQGSYSSLEKLENVEAGGKTSLCSSVMDWRGFSGAGASIIISDLMSDSEKDWSDALKYLIYRKQEVILVHILSSEEDDPQLDSAARLTDSETGEYIDVGSPAAASAYYRRALEGFNAEISSFCLRTGVRLLRIRSDEDPGDVIFGKGTAAGIFA